MKLLLEQKKVVHSDVNFSMSPAKLSVVYETYWRFAAERQSIFFKRVGGMKPPWTSDIILQNFKFTNVYRASDRVSQYLIRNVIYREDLPNSASEVFFRILLFKFFNKIETWETLEKHFGAITLDSYSFEAFNDLLLKRIENGKTIYSNAYIMPSGNSSFGYPKKHSNHLKLLEKMIKDELPEKIAGSKSMQKAFELLKAYPTLGDFLAYQYVIDINYSNITNFSESEFVVPGPGARDGIKKCFIDTGRLTEVDIIKLMADRQELEFEKIGLDFRTIGGRRLQLIDCQNIFCEVDKYSRVMHPEIQGHTGRVKIKQRYTENIKPVELYFPPKWGINL